MDINEKTDMETKRAIIAAANMGCELEDLDLYRDYKQREKANYWTNLMTYLVIGIALGVVIVAAVITSV